MTERERRTDNSWRFVSWLPGSLWFMVQIEF